MPKLMRRPVHWFIFLPASLALHSFVEAKEGSFRLIHCLNRITGFKDGQDFIPTGEGEKWK
jgi:hypothetical protein